ncbi:DDE family transposase [Kutzneria buriramensis]|uniref:DDE family transposase n=1 Tax=Kutzneria buriramensis TaxID=1045776 RepID=A0A3E0GVR3_9PSEU|nr:DDE family transposase [Kutzneria buriramensis]
MAIPLVGFGAIITSVVLPVDLGRPGGLVPNGTGPASSAMFVVVFSFFGAEIATIAKKWGSLTGPSSVDRGKPGSKIHVLFDRTGLPFSVAISAANTNDAYGLKPLVRTIPAARSRRGPRRCKPGKLHEDKAYDTRVTGVGA